MAAGSRTETGTDGEPPGRAKNGNQPNTGTMQPLNDCIRTDMPLHMERKYNKQKANEAWSNQLCIDACCGERTAHLAETPTDWDTDVVMAGSALAHIRSRQQADRKKGS